MEQKLFEQELAYYEANKERFFEIAPGMYVLLKNGKEFGFYDSFEDAWKAGENLFGDDLFFIHQILDEEGALDYPAYSLGQTHAGL